ncbi:uncharacterized protein LOC108668324 [Hyalella azteca]|uniref:Uncharacterized protein LOC108668324 n=1 Tax=Hyalella azteca TaxID=294128 RepID=A0A8B7NBM3_HYAAZ|nr:uncharacterized protein LOC108668324 [Hyalella azteca]
MLEYERRLFKLFQEIGGEEFEAAERLYLKVVKMKKTLEKRKKKEKAWALAQGPLGDRRAAYEEYLKTLDEGEEKQSFASYVEEMSMKKTEDSSDTEKTTLEAHEFSDEDCASSLDDEGSSDEEGNVAPNEESDLKQLELRNKIFEKLDAKLGKWNEEDSSDAEDIDIMPDTTKSLFTNDGNVSKQRKHVSQSVSSKSNVCEFEFARSQKNIDNRKRKRDSSLNDSEIDFSSNKKTILKSDEFFPSREALLKRDSELKIKSADSNKSAERDNIAKSSVNLSNEYQLDSGADTEKSHPSLFSLFKKTGFTTKRGKLSPEKKAKKPDALDLKIVASLYNKNNKPLAKSSFFVASFSSGTQNTNENTKDDAARIDDSVVPHRVLEMETELAEIPRPIAYEKAQKLNKEGMLDDDVSDDDQDERANFNSMFIFDNAKNFKQARGESSRNGSMSDSGRGRGVRGGRGARHDGRPRAKCGSDEDFGSTTPGRGKHNGRLPDAKLVEGRKFDVGGTGRGGTRGGKRAQRGGRSTAPYAATRSNDDSELLHPSWAAKKQNSGAIKGFQGKKITFD